MAYVWHRQRGMRYGAGFTRERQDHVRRSSGVTAIAFLQVGEVVLAWLITKKTAVQIGHLQLVSPEWAQV